MNKTSKKEIAVAMNTTTSSLYFSEMKVPRAGLIIKLAAKVADT